MNFRPMGRRARLHLPLAAAFVAAALRAGPPATQALSWEYGSNYALPASSHLGESLAVARAGTILLLAAPNDGARADYAWDDAAGWQPVNGFNYGGGAQFYELASDTLGIAFTRLDSDGTTSIRLHFGTGPSAIPLVEGISGLVTAIAKQGLTLAIGEAAYASGRGRVRIFEQSGGHWGLVETFLGAAGAGLGGALALDEDVLVAGATGEGDCGAAHVFLHAAAWVAWQTLDCPSATQLDADFGAALALDGGVLAVGAPRLDRLNPGGGPDFGGVYIFRPSGLLFELETFLRPTGTAAGDRFGSSVELYSNNETDLALLAGSPFEDGDAADSGAAYLYLDWGDGWRLHRRLASNEGEADQRLGTDLALGWTGALVGAPRCDANSVHDQGIVFAYNGVVPLFYDGFDRGDLSAWSQSAP